MVPWLRPALVVSVGLTDPSAFGNQRGGLPVSLCSIISLIIVKPSHKTCEINPKHKLQNIHLLKDSLKKNERSSGRNSFYSHPVHVDWHLVFTENYGKELEFTRR